MVTVPQPNKEEVFLYLDELRKSGKANMFLATEWIEAEFSIAPDGAKKLLVSWMNNYAERLGWVRTAAK